jgi:hypothetical protein
LHPVLSKVDDFTKRPGPAVFLSIFGALAALLGVLAFFRIDAENLPSKLAPLLIGAGAFSSLSAVFLVIRVYLDNRALRRVFTELHEVLHALRDHAVRRNFCTRGVTDQEVMVEEQRILDNFCREIAEMFSGLTGSRCNVCVTLVSEEKGTKQYFLWARSRADHLRDLDGMKFGLDEHSTKFNFATSFNPQENAFYWCPDLVKEEAKGKYKDPLRNWKQHYRSTLVVPIRFRTGMRELELVGFLKVESLSVHRLNNSFHVQLLAGCADALAMFLLKWRLTPLPLFQKAQF